MISQGSNLHPCSDAMRMTIRLRLFSPKPWETIMVFPKTMRKTSNKFKQITEGHSTKYITGTSQNCQSHQKQGNSEK